MNNRVSLFLFFIFCMGGYIFSQPKPKAEYDYLIYLPENYDKVDKEFPLVIYLHGGSQKGNDLNKLKSYSLPYLVDQGKDFDFIIVSPQCRENKYWSTEDWFEPLYSKISAEYRVDINKVYLTGISMGGYGTFITAMDYPDTFAAIVPLCGGCNDNDTTRICNLKNTPIWAFHGTADDKIPISETERIAAELDKCNGKIMFTKLEGEGHGIEYLYEKCPQIFEWLLKQSLSGNYR